MIPFIASIEIPRKIENNLLLPKYLFVSTDKQVISEATDLFKRSPFQIYISKIVALDVNKLLENMIQE